LKATTTNKDVIEILLSGNQLTSDRIYENEEVAKLVKKMESLKNEITKTRLDIIEIAGGYPKYLLEIDTDGDFSVTISGRKFTSSDRFYFKDFDELNLAINECVVKPNLFLKDVLNDAVKAMASGENYFCFDGNQRVELWKLCH
jgi:hypothetical protein